MAVEECEAYAAKINGSCNCVLEKLRSKRSIAMHITITGLRQDDFRNQGCRPRAPSARVPQGEAQILLSIVADEVSTKGLVDGFSHGDREVHVV
jgi:hypothetical protein